MTSLHKPSNLRLIQITIIVALLSVACWIYWFQLHQSNKSSVPPVSTGQMEVAKPSPKKTTKPKPTTNVTPPKPTYPTYPAHTNILATMFWVGELPSSDNKQIPNTSSTWIEDWVKAYGGIDNPKSRCGYLPCAFTPKENPFYFALPFNDYTEEGRLKPLSVLKRIPWYAKPPAEDRSLVKNRWIAVTYEGKTVYAQWEDAGPYGENDVDYVFGTKPPKVNIGLDLSPAATGYLGLNGMERVSWRFVDHRAVPNGPWKKTITTSGIIFPE